MKHIFANKTGLLFTMGCALALTTTGCIRESLDACPAHQLTVKVINEKGGEITETAGERIEEVTVFLFDESLVHLNTYHMSAADVEGHRKIDLAYPEGTKLRAIAWGNAYAGNQTINDNVDLAEQLKVMLKKEQEKATIPDELYYGKENIVTKALEVQSVDTVTIQVIVGELRAFTDGMPAKYQAALKTGLKADGLDPLKVYVNRTLSTWNYDGKLEGDSVYYMPEPLLGVDQDPNISPEEMSTDYQYYAPQPGGMNLVLELPDAPAKQEWVDMVDGDPIRVEVGRKTEVMFEWDGEGNYLGVRVTVRDWGFVDDPIEW